MPPSSPRTSRAATSASQTPIAKLAALTAVSLLGLVALGAFAAQFWIESYLGSPAFKAKAEGALGHVLHSKVELSRLKREGTALFSQSLSSAGTAGAVVSTMNADGLRAEFDLSALWRRTWHLSALRVQQLDLSTAAPSSSELPETQPESVPAAKPRFAFLLPKKTKVGTIHIDKVRFSWGSGELRDTRVTAIPSTNGWELRATGGELKLPGTPALSLDSASLLLRKNELVLKTATLSLKEGGKVSASGLFSKTDSQCDLRFENVSLTPFLSPWWQPRLRGTANGDLRLSYSAENGPASIQGSVQLAGARIEGLPLLSQLDAFLGNSRFSSVPLNKATANIRITPPKTVLEDIQIDGDGLLKIHGSLDLDPPRIAGLFQLGIPNPLTQWLPTSKLGIFSGQKDGFIWIPVRISGDKDSPMEDLSSKLAAATPPAETIKGVIPTAPIPAPLKEAGKEAGKAAIEAGKAAIDTLRSILPGK